MSGLGLGSNIAAALDPDAAKWDRKDEMLACLVEQVQGLAMAFHHVWFKPPHPEPVRWPRPYDPPPEPPRTTRHDFRRSLLGEG